MNTSFEQLFPPTGDAPVYPPINLSFPEDHQPKYIAIDIEKAGRNLRNPITHLGIVVADDTGILGAYPFRLPVVFPSQEDMLAGNVDENVWEKRCCKEFWGNKDAVHPSVFVELTKNMEPLAGSYYHAMQYVCKCLAALINTVKVEMVFIGDNLLFDLGSLNHAFEFFQGMPLPYSEKYNYHGYKEVNSALYTYPKEMWEPLAKDMAQTNSMTTPFNIANNHLPVSDAAFMIIKFWLVRMLKEAQALALVKDFQSQGIVSSYLLAKTGGAFKAVRAAHLNLQTKVREKVARQLDEDTSLHDRDCVDRVRKMLKSPFYEPPSDIYREIILDDVAKEIKTNTYPSGTTPYFAQGPAHVPPKSSAVVSSTPSEEPPKDSETTATEEPSNAIDETMQEASMLSEIVSGNR